MKLQCCCGAVMEPRMLEEESPLSYRLRFDCTRCANSVTTGGRLEEVAPFITRRLWSNEARHELERLPPYIGPMVQTEVERYADRTHQLPITMSLYQEARNRGKVSWSAAAEGRLSNIPPAIRSLAKVEIERMAIARGLVEVTDSLMDEAKAKFLGMRG